MTWYFFELQNKELRTCPDGFGGVRVSQLVWTKDWSGQVVKPGDILAVVTFDGGAEPQHFLAAPPNCTGTVIETRDLDVANQARHPSQLLLFLE